MGHSRPLFLYFLSFKYTVNSKQMFNIYNFLPMTGFELQTSGIVSNRSTNCKVTFILQIPFARKLSFCKCLLQGNFHFANAFARQLTGKHDFLQNYNIQHPDLIWHTLIEVYNVAKVNQVLLLKYTNQIQMINIVVYKDFMFASYHGKVSVNIGYGVYQYFLFLKMGHARPLFLYSCLFNTVDSR